MVSGHAAPPLLPPVAHAAGAPQTSLGAPAQSVTAIGGHVQRPRRSPALPLDAGAEVQDGRRGRGRGQERAGGLLQGQRQRVVGGQWGGECRAQEIPLGQRRRAGGRGRRGGLEDGLQRRLLGLHLAASLLQNGADGLVRPAAPASPSRTAATPAFQPCVRWLSMGQVWRRMERGEIRTLGAVKHIHDARLFIQCSDSSSRSTSQNFSIEYLKYIGQSLSQYCTKTHNNVHSYITTIFYIKNHHVTKHYMWFYHYIIMYYF